MSVVACKVYENKIVIASDSISVSGATQRRNDGKNGSYSKLTRINGMVVGSVGSCEENALFINYCATRTPKSNTEDAILEFITDFADWKKKKTDLPYGQDNDYIIIYGAKAFYIERFWVKRIDDYSAIGAGRDFALASLYLGNDPEKAADAACELSIYCEKPVQVMEVV